MMVYPVKSMAAVQASHQQGQQQQQSVQEARSYHGLKLKVGVQQPIQLEIGELYEVHRRILHRHFHQALHFICIKSR